MVEFFRNRVASILRRSLRRLGLARLGKSRHISLQGFVYSLLPDASDRPASISCIIFSFDRPLQLDATLRSLKLHLERQIEIRIIYRCSNKKISEYYDDIQLRYPDVVLINEEKQGFRNTLIQAVTNLCTDKIFFLVDDIIFIRKLPLHDMLSFDSKWFVPSLRLGLSLTRCYTLNCSQPRPPFLPSPDSRWLIWEWRLGEADWGYPLSVDGNIFDRVEFLQMIKGIEFKAPNSLEKNLQVFLPNFQARFGISAQLPCLVNIPCNRVQNEITNRAGSTVLDDLHAAWEAHLQIDIDAFNGLKPISAHQEIPFVFQPR